MLNKIILTIGSALTIALTSFGIWSARQLVETTPYCYDGLSFNAFNYADTYMLLIIGVGAGIGLATIIRTLTD